MIAGFIQSLGLYGVNSDPGKQMIFDIHLIVYHILRFLDKDDYSLRRYRLLNQLTNELVLQNYPDLHLNRFLKTAKQLNRLIQLHPMKNEPIKWRYIFAHPDYSNKDLALYVYHFANIKSEYYLQFQSDFDPEKGKVIYNHLIPFSMSEKQFRYFTSLSIPSGFSKMDKTHYFTIFSVDSDFLIVDYTDFENIQFHSVPNFEKNNPYQQAFFKQTGFVYFYPDLTLLPFLDIDVLYKEKHLIPLIDSNVILRNENCFISIQVGETNSTMSITKMNKYGIQEDLLNNNLIPKYHCFSLMKDRYSLFCLFDGFLLSDMIIMDVRKGIHLFKVAVDKLQYQHSTNIGENILCVMLSSPKTKVVYFYLFDIKQRRWVMNFYNNPRILETNFLYFEQTTQNTATIWCNSRTLPFQIKIDLNKLQLLH